MQAWTLRSLPRAVWLLGVISLLNDAASELVYPLLPLFVATTLSGGPFALGLVEGAAEASASLLKLVSGAWYDRIGRARPFVIVGYAAAAVARPVIALAQTWPVVLGLRVADRVGKGLRSAPRDALLSRSVPPEQLGIAFGVHRAFDNAGAVIGPLMAAALLALGMPVRRILGWAVVPGILCVLLALWVREPAARAPSATAPTWHWQALPPRFRRLLVAVGLFALGNVSSVFFLLRASQLGLSGTSVALLWSLVSTLSTLLSVPLSAWSDRVGRMPLLLGGWCLFGLLCIALGTATGTAIVWPLAAALGVYLAATEGVERALVGDAVEPAQRGSAYGWYHLVRGGMLLPSAAWIGATWELLDARWAFFGAGACALLASVLLLVWARPALPAASEQSAQ
ncbi:MAG TPA: MFS transporter [Burkholderiaceae bacterium]|nr:MFS transporter [Burkholderiaceae bacterium]